MAPCLLGSLIATGLTLVLPGRAGAQSIQLVDGTVLKGHVLTPMLPPSDNHAEVSVMGPDGKKKTLPLEDIVLVDYEKVSGRPAEPSVRLRNGDQIYGRVSFPEPRRVRIAAGWGVVTVPLRWCEGVRPGQGAKLPPPGDSDAVWLANGDRVEGRITGVSGGKVNLSLDGVDVPVALDRVLAFTFARRDPPPAPTGLLVRLDLGGGERITGRWAGMDADAITIAPPWGPEVVVPVGSVSRLEVKNGRLVYLSDLTPVEVVQTPYLDRAYPHRIDRSNGGRPLRLGPKTYRRGLGVHSYSALTFTLGGGFELFTTTMGIDNEVGDQGSVIFRIFGDGKLLHETPILRGGDPPRVISLPVKGVLLLRLEVDYGDGGDAADHADWADARVLR